MVGIDSSTGSLFDGLLLALVFLAAGPAGLLGLEGREGGEVDLLLGGGPDQELVGVDEVLADLDVALVDQHAGLVDGLGLEALLVDPGLDALVQELVEGEAQHVIELELLPGQQAVAVHAVQQGGSLEQSSGVFLLESQQLSGRLSELGQQQVHSPHLTLVLEAVLAHQLQLVVDTLLLEGTTRGVEGRRV
jgi:hypothetical protein